MKRQRCRRVVIIFLTVMALAGGTAVAMPSRGFSANENRYLAVWPTLDAASLWSGLFQKGMAAYVSDHFVLRDGLTAAAGAIQRAQGRRDINGAYLGADGWLLAAITSQDIDTELYGRSLALLDRLAADSGVPMVVMPVPDAGIVMKDELPPLAPMYDAAALYATARQVLTHAAIVDPTDALRQASGQRYYRTDHHWTSLGAYVGYRCLAPALGLTARPADGFGFHMVTDAFRGSLYSKVLNPDAPYDDISIAAQPAGLQVTADGKPMDGLYDMTALQGKDKYSVFLGGNHGRLDIDTGHGGPTLLVIKDSFANCLVPLLTGDYAHIIMIDLRYYEGRIGSLVTEQHVDAIAVVYQLSNLASDTSLMKLALG